MSHRNRHFVVWSVWGLLVLSAGCQRYDRDEVRIPPPYTPELKAQRETAEIEFLTNCIRRRIDLPGSYYRRSKVYYTQTAYEKALDDVNNAISLKDNIGEYYLLRGLVNRELNRMEEALGDAERAEALQQSGPELYVLLADIFQEQRKFPEAEKYISTILQVAPYDGHAHHVKGMLEAGKGDTLSGIASLEKAITLNPKLMRAYRQVTTMYYRTGDYGNAERVSGKALKHFPENTGLLREIASMYRSMQKYDSAAIYYRQIIRLAPDLVEAQADLADLYVRARNYSAALGIYEKIREKDTDYPSILFLIGFCHEKMWRFNTARSYYEQQLERTPGAPEARYGIWRITQQENQKTELPDESSDEGPEKTLDDSRIQIAPIQPRTIQ